MKKVVIAGSAKLQQEIQNWRKFFINKGYEVLDYPKKIDETKFMELYPNVHKEFFENITKTDMLFIINQLLSQPKCQLRKRFSTYIS